MQVLEVQVSTNLSITFFKSNGRAGKVYLLGILYYSVNHVAIINFI